MSDINWPALKLIAPQKSWDTLQALAASKTRGFSRKALDELKVRKIDQLRAEMANQQGAR